MSFETITSFVQQVVSPNNFKINNFAGLPALPGLQVDSITVAFRNKMASNPESLTNSVGTKVELPREVTVKGYLATNQHFVIRNLMGNKQAPFTVSWQGSITPFLVLTGAEMSIDTDALLFAVELTFKQLFVKLPSNRLNPAQASDSDVTDRGTVEAY